MIIKIITRAASWHEGSQRMICGFTQQCSRLLKWTVGVMALVVLYSVSLRLTDFFISCQHTGVFVKLIIWKSCAVTCVFVCFGWFIVQLANYNALVQLMMQRPQLLAAWCNAKRPSLSDFFLFSVPSPPHLSSRLITERHLSLISNVHLTFSDLLFQSMATHGHTHCLLTHVYTRTETRKCTHILVRAQSGTLPYSPAICCLWHHIVC